MYDQLPPLRAGMALLHLHDEDGTIHPYSLHWLSAPLSAQFEAFETFRHLGRYKLAYAVRVKHVNKEWARG